NKIFLRISDGEKPKFNDIFKEYSLFWKFLGVSILMPIVVFVGLILLIVPGIIWAVRFSLAPLILVDTKIGPIASMKESWAITRGNFWKMLGFWIVIGLINLLGLLIIGVGLLITFPISTFAMIHVYRFLSSSRAAVVTEPAPMPAPVA
ncbi:MAG: YciC family protein, partial [Patescibacteria group bacterium]